MQEVDNVHVDGGIEAGCKLGDVPEVPEVVVAGNSLPTTARVHGVDPQHGATQFILCDFWTGRNFLVFRCPKYLHIIKV